MNLCKELEHLVSDVKKDIIIVGDLISQKLIGSHVTQLIRVLEVQLF